MSQLYVPFSKLTVDAVFKILDKEKSKTKFGETLVIYLEQNPADNNYDADVIIKTYAPTAYADATTKNYVDLGIMNATKISRLGGIKKDAQTNLNSTCHKHKDW